MKQSVLFLVRTQKSHRKSAAGFGLQTSSGFGPPARGPPQLHGPQSTVSGRSIVPTKLSGKRLLRFCTVASPHTLEALEQPT